MIDLVKLLILFQYDDETSTNINLEWLRRLTPLTYTVEALYV